MDKIANIIVPVILFILFTPGLLFQIPDESKPLWQSTLVHAILFAITYLILRTIFKSYY